MLRQLLVSQTSLLAHGTRRGFSSALNAQVRQFASEDLSVLICGAGITGLLCSLALPCPSRLIDAGPSVQPYDDIAMVLPANLLARFFALSETVGDALLEQGTQLRHFRAHLGSGHELGSFSAEDTDLPHISISLDRLHKILLSEVIAGRASRSEEGPLWEASVAKAVGPVHGLVNVTFNDESRLEESNYHVVVVADGAVPKTVDESSRFKTSAPTRWDLVLPRPIFLAHSTVFDIWGDGARLLVVPMTEDTVNVVGVARPSSSEATPTKEAFVEVFSRHFEWEDVSSLMQFIQSTPVSLCKTRPNEAYTSPPTPSDHIIFAGDAAHQMPSTCYGIDLDQCVQDAIVLGGQIFGGNLTSRHLLEAFLKKRKKQVSAAMLRAHFLSTAGTLSSTKTPLRYPLRNLALRALFTDRALAAEIQNFLL
eukprot:gnl/Hemi2/5647_TR1944_c0_g1_i1.p1 gnl/Hemi2/5647_TR1944_c0_g1~~gnl/Hemi2/5647_TR1944_c0_g1_i1.p1  ORF type:complete len:424 (-),score=53.46 gnl/Hemi2/5647_TR1944_c0_g1_i1:57-1328(-)